MTRLIIDQCNFVLGRPNADLKAMKALRYTANRMVLDEKGTTYLEETVIKYADDIAGVFDRDDYVRPHPNLYVEFARTDRLCRSAILINEQSVWHLSVDSKDMIRGNVFKFDFASHDLKHVLYDYEDFNEEERDEMEDDAGIMLLMMTALFMTLNRPSAITIDHRPAYAILRKGKRVAFAAHSIVRINLNKPTEFKKLFFYDDRKSPIGHTVRGHWLHYRTVNDCSKRWKGDKNLADDLAHPWSDLDGRHQECSVCHTRRTKRFAFQRGDASRGFVHKDQYEVTA